MASSIKYCWGSRPTARALASPSRRKWRMRYRNSASARYSAGVISNPMVQVYRSAIYLATRRAEPVTGLIYRGRGDSQRLAEGFLRLIVFVPLTFVEFMSAFADHVGSHGHAWAAVLARPIFGGFQKPSARAKAALVFCNN